MGKIVFAAAMSHVLDPDYYQAACGLTGRRKVEACMAEIEKLGETFLARRPDALIVVADDHLNAFSFNAVPAICVRIGRYVNRMIQDEAEAFDKVLDGMPERYTLHEFLNWMTLIGAVTPARADVRYFGELGRINLAAVEWRVA